MNIQSFQLIRMMLDPRIASRPLRALAKLRARGIRRLPAAIDDDLQRKGRRRAARAFIAQWLDGEMFTRHRRQWVLNSFLPPFPGPAYDRLFENLFSGRHLSPVSAFLAITSACPCRCAHCSAQRPVAGELDTAAWLDVLRQLQRLGTSLVGLTGGEPLQRPDTPALVAECHRLGLASILFTSGAGVTAEKIQELRAARLWACCVSLDSDREEEHDRLRGRAGAFRDAMETIRLSRAAGFYTMISSVATRALVESAQYERLYALARKLGVHEYRLVEPMPCGAMADAGDDLLLRSEHLRALRAFHVETNRRQKPPKVCAFNQIESPEIFGCGAGTQHLYIQPDGVVCPCDFTPLGFGNVTDTPLEAIWKRMNLAMGDNPRRDCFIQKHHALIHRYKDRGYPLPPEVSETVCREAGPEPLPGYFAMVTGQQKETNT